MNQNEDNHQNDVFLTASETNINEKGQNNEIEYENHAISDHSQEYTEHNVENEKNIEDVAHTNNEIDFNDNGDNDVGNSENLVNDSDMSDPMTKNSDFSIQQIANINKVYSPPQDGTVSIINFESICRNCIPEFTEDSTILAINRLAINVKLLKPVGDEDLVEYDQYPDIKKKAHYILDSRRLNLIQNIKDEREKIINQSKHKNSGNTTRSSVDGQESRIHQIQLEAKKNAEVEYERIQNLQKKEIEQLILAEIIREKTIRDEEIRRERREKIAADRENEVKKKIAAEAQKRHEKEQLLLKKVADKEKQIIEMRKKQELDVEKNQKLIQERKEKQLKAISDAEKNRQQKAIKQREIFERQMDEEKKRIVAKQQEQVKHEMLMLQRRANQVQSIKERNAKVFSEQRARFEIGLQREKENFEKKRLEIERKEVQSHERIFKAKQKLIENSLKTRARSQLLVERHHQSAEKIRQNEEERIRMLVLKENKSDEKRLAILQAKIDQSKKEQQEFEAKLKRIKEQKASKELEHNQKSVQILQNWEQNQSHVQEVNQLKEEEIRKKAIIKKLKAQIRDENAQRLAQYQENLIKERSELAEERETSAMIYVQHKKQLAQKRLESSVELDFKKESIMNDFNEMMKHGGHIDIDQLAKKFDIDVDSLKKKIEMSNSQKDTYQLDSLQNDMNK